MFHPVGLHRDHQEVVFGWLRCLDFGVHPVRIQKHIESSTWAPFGIKVDLSITYPWHIHVPEPSYWVCGEFFSIRMWNPLRLGMQGLPDEEVRVENRWFGSLVPCTYVLWLIFSMNTSSRYLYTIICNIIIITIIIITWYLLVLKL